MHKAFQGAQSRLHTRSSSNFCRVASSGPLQLHTGMLHSCLRSVARQVRKRGQESNDDGQEDGGEEILGSQ